MIKVKLSRFIKENINKLRDLGSKLIIVAIVITIATIMISFNNGENNTKFTQDNKDVYKPTDTMMKGQDISKQQYESDLNIVNEFLGYCNNGRVEEAYSLLSEGCKKELYNTIEDFKKYYYNNIFSKKRECNLQSWISTINYTVYKVRYTNNMLSTGTYDKSDVYQDYITIDKNSNNPKISIGEFVYETDYNVITKTSLLEAIVRKKRIYVSYEEYEIQIKNNTNKTILLDNLETGTTIRLIGNGAQYLAYSNKLFSTNLTINPGGTKTITIRFKKDLSSNNLSEKIQFLNVIKDKEIYEKDKQNYKDTTNITIKLED